MFGVTGFSIISVLMKLIFILMVGIVIAKIIGHCLQWNYKQQLPRCTVIATVVSKRTSIIYLSDTDHHHTSRRYFVTFKMKNGDRMEFCVSAPEYMRLTENNKGMLSFQGTRYMEFEREL